MCVYVCAQPYPADNTGMCSANMTSWHGITNKHTSLTITREAASTAHETALSRGQEGSSYIHTKHKNTCDIQTHQNHLPFNPHIHNHIHNYTYLAPAREAASTAHEAAHGGGLHRGQDGQHSTLLRTLCFDDLQHPSCLPHTPPSLPRSRACMLHLPCRHANAGDMRVTARMAVLLLCA